jgi:hypothetical protein
VRREFNVEVVVEIEIELQVLWKLGLSVGEKTSVFWYARTPKSPPLKPASLALPQLKINTAFRFTSQKAAKPEY